MPEERGRPVSEPSRPDPGQRAATSTPDRAQVDEADLRRRLGALGLEQKVRLLTGETFWTLPAELAVGLRPVTVSDGPAGVRGVLWDERDPSANVPSPTALAASWDVDSVHRMGRLLAAECRRKRVDVLLAPTVNLHRTPYGGRHFECFSEDPLLTGVIGRAYVDGLQSQGVAATVKHFVANDSETERFTVDVAVDERTLRELYLAPFETITCEGHAWAVMAAYNGVAGTTMTESPLLDSVLKAEWGYDGMVMSDWFATRSTRAAGNAGLDLAMPGPVSPWSDALVAAVRDGSVRAEAVDEKVLRVLRLAARVGALDGVAPARPGADAWSDAEIAAELRASAAAGTVLLRNEPTTPGGTPILPLDAGELLRMAVVGPNAARPRTLGGGSATVFPTYTVSAVEGMRVALARSGSAGVEVVTSIGVRPNTRLPVAPLEMLQLADGSGHGVEVTFLDAEGVVLGAERRFGGTLNWIAGLPVPDPAAVQVVEVRGRLHAVHGDGEYALGCSGVGRFALEVDGRQAFDQLVQPEPDADAAQTLSRPPQASVGVELAAGQSVPFVLRHLVGAHDVGPVVARPGVIMQLNAEAPYGTDDEEIARAVALARRSDIAVVVVGTTEEDECEGYDRESLALPGRQDELVRAVAAANPRTVVAVNAGSPVLMPWVTEVPAILMTWFPGQEAGNALADVLLGTAEPGGRLPVSWSASEDRLPSTTPVDGVLRYDEGLFIGYRGYDRDGREPLFPFGHGLGYTDWQYSDLAVPASATGWADLEVTVRLANTGNRAGRAVVQVYASRPGSALERPVRTLAGFAAVGAAADAGAIATMRIPARALQHWDVAAHAWAVEPGPVELSAGPSSRDLRVTATVTIS
jgi:beta-glucosidase